MTVSSVPYKNVFDLARAYPVSHSAVFNRLFDVDVGHPRCRGTAALTEKYGVQQDNVQTVVSVTNRVTLLQAWYNEARTQKPQTFTTEPLIVDPTDGGRNCDFCDWQNYTAEDSFGRIESRYAVTASNLFKYCHPHQGVVLFKHHDPLSFSLPQLADLLDVSDSWFQAAAAAVAGSPAGAPCQQEQQQKGSQDGAGWPQPARLQQLQPGQAGRRPHLHPLFIWNCLPRAGASQFHGHAQVMLSSSPFPHLQRERESAACYDAMHQGSGYYQDLLAAYDAVGLLRQAGPEGDRAFCYPSLSPTKDMEVLVHGSHVRSPAFQLLFFAALRALIDELGVKTFNAAIYNISLAGQGVGLAGLGAATQPQQQPQQGDGVGGFQSAGEPVIARVVSRGKLGSQASDFGGLEVFGGASIANTDPWTVARALDAVLARQQEL